MHLKYVILQLAEEAVSLRDGLPRDTVSQWPVARRAAANASRGLDFAANHFVKAAALAFQKMPKQVVIHDHGQHSAFLGDQEDDDNAASVPDAKDRPNDRFTIGCPTLSFQGGDVHGPSPVRVCRTEIDLQVSPELLRVRVGLWRGEGQGQVNGLFQGGANANGADERLVPRETWTGDRKREGMLLGHDFVPQWDDLANAEDDTDQR